MTSQRPQFDYTLNYKQLDFREHPDLYKVGRGEQGVLLVQPYKSELLPHWRFRTPEDARKSVRALMKKFKQYENDDDFVGMDMARKFIQMGYTRSRRYANHKSGQKYDGPVPQHLKGQSGAHGRAQLPRELDKMKAQSAKIFKKAWEQVELKNKYRAMKAEWKLWYG